MLICGIAMSQSAASAVGPPLTPSIIVSRPQPGETIHDNRGAVPVAVALRGVTLAAGNRPPVLMGGKAHGADQRTLEFTLEAVERGEHALQVQLLDAKGALIAASPAVTFYVFSAARVHQLVLNGVADEFGLVAHVHFFQDVCLVRADGLRTQH